MFQSTSRYFKFFLSFSLIFSFFTLLLVVYKYSSLPQHIPLFYSHNWGISQLAPKQLIYLPLVFQLFMFLLAFRLKNTLPDDFSIKAVFFSVAAGNMLADLAILRIVDLVSFLKPWPMFLNPKIMLTFFSALIVSLFFHPLTISLATKFKLVDDPKIRKHPAMLQKHAIPRAGALPIFLGFLAAIVMFAPLTKPVVGIIIGGFIALVVGIWDDKADLNPYFRFVFSNMLAALAVIAAGIGIAYFNIPIVDKIVDLGAINFKLGSHNITLLADLFDFVWIIWVMNMLNWSKGVDGQFPGIVIITALVIGILSLRLAPHDPTQLTLAQIAFAAAGATLGFLVFNWHPSKILPGYGTTFLGLTLATLSIYSGAKVAVAILVLLVPTLDAMAAILRRVLRGHSPFWHDREHLHHRLLNRGWSHQQIAYFYWSVTAVGGLIALLTAGRQRLLAFLVLAGIAGFGIAVLNLQHLFKKGDDKGSMLNL